MGHWTLRLRHTFALLTIAGALNGCARDDAYPSRPITIVCPWSVGGGTDRVSRQMAFFLEHELGVPVNVINATGGRGVTGHSRGLRAKPDGYTLSMMTVELNMLHWQDLTRISYEDAVPLMSLNEDAAALFVHADAPWESLADLRAAIEPEPGTLTASGTAAGGIWHLAFVGWLEAAGLESNAVKWISSEGAGPSLQELGSKGIQLVCCSLPEADEQLRNNSVRCLGVMAESRVAGYEDVPTFRELGADWTMVGWRGLGVAEGTPADRVETLVAAIERIVSGETQVDGKSFPDFMRQQKFNNSWRPPDEFLKFLEENDRKFGAILKSDAFANLPTQAVGPYSFPLVLGVIGVLLIAAIGVQSGRTDSLDSTKPDVVWSSLNWGNAACVVLAVAAYLTFAEPAGFVVTAAGCLFVLMWKFGTRIPWCLAVTVVLVPAAYQFFAHVMRLPLPRGILGW